MSVARGVEFNVYHHAPAGPCRSAARACWPRSPKTNAPPHIGNQGSHRCHPGPAYAMCERNNTKSHSECIQPFATGAIAAFPPPINNCMQNRMCAQDSTNHTKIPRHTKTPQHTSIACRSVTSARPKRVTPATMDKSGSADSTSACCIRPLPPFFRLPLSSSES